MTRVDDATLELMSNIQQGWSFRNVDTGQVTTVRLSDVIADNVRLRAIVRRFIAEMDEYHAADMGLLEEYHQSVELLGKDDA